MIDVFLETLLATFFLAIALLLWLRRSRYRLAARWPMLLGFAVLFVAAAFEAMDNVAGSRGLPSPALSTAVAPAFTALAYLFGTLLIFIGFLRLAPVSDELDKSLASLQESRDRFRLAMEGSSSGYWDWIDPGRRNSLWLSERFYELLGYTPGEFPAEFSWLLAALHPQDRDRVQAALNAHLHKRCPFHIEYRLRTRRGEYRWFQARGQAQWDAGGEAQRMSGSIDDITERKLYQHAIQQLSSEVAHFTGYSYLDNLVIQLHQLFDVECVMIAVLEDQEKGAALHSVSLCMDGQIAEDIDWPVAGSPGAAVLETGSACTVRTGIRERYPDDTLLAGAGIESYIGIPLLTAEGDSLGLMALMDKKHINNDLFVIEIAQLFADRAVAELGRIQAEAELALHREHLEELVVRRTEDLHRANKELESFSYSVSHDLRAPLRAIDGFSESLLVDCGEQLDTTAHDYLQRIRRNTRRMGELIDDLLVLSRVTRHEIRISRVDISQLCHEIVDQLRADDPQRDVEVHIQPHVQARADAKLLRILLENLIGNAWKFTAKTPRARIAFAAEAGDPSPVYRLSDNGAGFDMNYADKLFEVFQRLHAEHDFEGTGVGLATVRRVLDRHGGRIWAQGTPGAGATFRFTLRHADPQPVAANPGLPTRDQ